MLTIDQIDAEAITPALTVTQQKNLQLLVNQYAGYAGSLAQYSSFQTRLQAEVDTPTETTQILKAVITALAVLPPLVVESSGSTDRPSFFTTKSNWDALAQDVLDALFPELPNLAYGSQRFALAQRRVPPLVKEDINIVRGRRRTL